jgi:hypothetical protein
MIRIIFIRGYLRLLHNKGYKTLHSWRWWNFRDREAYPEMSVFGLIRKTAVKKLQENNNIHISFDKKGNKVLLTENLIFG